MTRKSGFPLRLLLLGLAASVWSCGGSGSQDELAQLHAENEALRTSLARQEAEEQRDAASSTLNPSPSSSEDWSWVSAHDKDPVEKSPSPVIEPAPEPKLDPPSVAPEPRAPKPKPRAPEPQPPAPEPEPEPLAVPEPTPLPMETRRAPAGSSIEVLMTAAMDSQTSLVGDAVSARLDRDLLDAEGRVVLGAGTLLSGRITEVQAAKKVKKKSKLAFQLDSATLEDGRVVAISAGRSMEGPGWDKRDGMVIGGSAAGGAVLGQVLGGDSEATAAGAVIGGAIASGVLMSQKGEATVVAEGTALELVLRDEVSVERPST